MTVICKKKKKKKKSKCHIGSTFLLYVQECNQNLLTAECPVKNNADVWKDELGVRGRRGLHRQSSLKFKYKTKHDLFCMFTEAIIYCGYTIIVLIIFDSHIF